MSPLNPKPAPLGFTAPEVKGTVIEVMEAAEGPLTKSQVFQRVMGSLGFAGSWWDEDGRRLDGQVGRALDALDIAKVIVKVRNGDRAPSERGWQRNSQPLFYRKDRYKALSAAADAYARETRQTRDLADSLVKRATDLGLSGLRVDRVRNNVEVDVPTLATLLFAYEESL